jgi:hypothetical protein
MKKVFETNLNKLRDKIKKYEKSSVSNIDHLIKLYKKLDKKETMKSKLCSIYSLKDWQIQNGKIFHKSKQFFSVHGVKINSAKREVKKWDQLILNQPHGGILAWLTKIISQMAEEEPLEQIILALLMDISKMDFYMGIVKK